MMARTRKRDDDSQYNSDATSLPALDASSMSAAGSRSSLTFASSTKALKKKRRPAKRRKKSLTDALQSISLDKDKGVPQQILSATSKCGSFPFSKSVAFTTVPLSGNTSPLMFGSVTGVPNFNALNSKQQANRQMDRGSSDGDIYYDDDKSQLTMSSEEEQNSGILDGMEDDFDDDDEEDNDDDSLRKRLATMTDYEKAQRKIMLQLVFGKDHAEDSNKSKGDKKSDKQSSAVRPPVKMSSAQSPPFTTISTMTKSRPTKIETSLMAPIPLKATPLIFDADDEKAKNGDLKNPVDRKIEELLRKSLKNLREGSHPLRLCNSKNNNSDSSFSNPRKTQDDMAIDPQIYSRKTPLNNHSMDLDNTVGSKDTVTKKTQNNNLQVPRFRIKRSNSLPGGLDMAESTNVAMDMDG